MKREKSLSLYLLAAILVALVSMALLWVSQPNNALGGAFTGSAAVQSIATTTTVGPDTVVTIFSAKKSCTARAISVTGGGGIPVHFLTGDPTNGDLASTTLSGVTGNIQAASTTVTYDSGLNGCGRWTAWASASTTITLVEYQ